MPLDYASLPKDVQALADRAAGKKPRQKRTSKSVDQYQGIQTNISRHKRQECPIHKHVWYSKEPVACFDCEYENEEAGTINPGPCAGDRNVSS
jgi:hypothetical protein